MDHVFYVLGLLALLVGAGWKGQVGVNAGTFSLASVFAATSELALIVSGLGILAVASGLSFLRRIASNTADTADALEGS